MSGLFKEAVHVSKSYGNGSACVEARPRRAAQISDARGHSFSDCDSKVVSIINLTSVPALEDMVHTPVNPLRFRGKCLCRRINSCARIGTTPMCCGDCRRRRSCALREIYSRSIRRSSEIRSGGCAPAMARRAMDLRLPQRR
jgi:hypothetical protein